MHSNLEKRFVELECARARLIVAVIEFKARYELLFASLAQDLNITLKDLGERVGFEPMAPDGNLIVRGIAEPSWEDCIKLVWEWEKSTAQRQKEAVET